MRLLNYRFAAALSGALALAACGGSDEPEDADVVDDTSGRGDSGGPADTGTDTGADAGADTGTDTGTDASDAGTDATTDATTDPDTDTGTGTDAGADTGGDTGTDAGGDSGTDAGTDPEVTWCRLQFPADLTTPTGTTFTSYGRVYAAGVTDLTGATDPAEGFVAEVGIGPDGSSPDDTWTWTTAVPNEGWDDEAEPGNDEYQADLTSPDPGEYDLAWRFSADGGATWLLCDTRVGESDGAADGYQTENAGRLVSTDPCIGACEVAPAPECVDADTLRTYGTVATCDLVDGEPVCDWAPVDTDCTADGLECMAGACVEGIDPPTAAGDIVITEFMARSISGADPGEWFELHNPTDAPLDLEGCTIGDDDGPDDTIDVALVVPVGGYVVLAGSADTADTGGFEPAWAWSTFALSNSGDEIVLTCGETVIDRVAYAGSDVVLATALQLASDRLDAELNDDLANWCDATDAFGDTGRLGTPGAGNGDCTAPVWSVDWCRLQFPDTIAGPPGFVAPVYVRVFIDGLTDRTAGVDPDGNLKVQVGFGPDATDPSTTEGDLWAWVDASGTIGWDDVAAGEPGNDEYVADLTTPDAPGETRRFAGRVSGDGGITWAYCDRNVGTGSDGLADGFQADNVGVMLIETVADVCEPNPCIDPPADACDSTTILKIYDAIGACTDVDGIPDCAYVETVVDCSDEGLVCADGACVEATPVPSPGDFVITEIMARSRAGAGDTGEFVELLNASGSAWDLAGCSLGEVDAPDWTIPGPTIVEPGERVVFAASAVAAENGGIVDAIAWSGFALGNSGDSVVLRCGPDGAIVDAVTYTGGDVTLGISWQLDASKENALDNDLGENWCPSAVSAETYDLFGTPGLPNLTCGGAADLTVDWCNLQFPTLIEGFEGNVVDVYGRLYIEGLTDATPGPDRVTAVRGEVGFGPDGVDPADGAWTWTPGAANDAFTDLSNDEYVAALTLPVPGEYDVAWRFTGDSGATWAYCDTGEGLADGYSAVTAGTMTVTEAVDLCVDVVCDTPPAASCDGPSNLLTYEPIGTCSVVDSSPLCEYPRTATDCAADGRICRDGACVFETSGRAPTPGDLVITEIMPRAFAGTGDPGEFVELLNVTEDELDLTDCSLGDVDGGEWTLPGGTSLAPGEYLVLASSDSATENGGLPSPIAWSGVGLSNSGESVYVRCGEPATVIDIATYTGSDVVLGVSISLDPAASRDDLNDDANQWCASAGTVAGYALTGSPGAANPVCAFEPLPVGWCAIQWPPTIEGAPGDLVGVFGVVWIDGLTNIDDAPNTSSSAWGEWGYGPDGAPPAARPAEWTWVRAMPNDGFVDAANDEYMWSAELPSAGAYDHAWRFTGDHGETWTYCDNLPAGAGDGYSIETTGAMTVE